MVNWRKNIVVRIRLFKYLVVFLIFFGASKFHVTTILINVGIFQVVRLREFMEGLKSL